MDPSDYALVPRRATREMARAYLGDALHVSTPENVRFVSEVYRRMVEFGRISTGIPLPAKTIPLPRDLDEARAMWILGENFVRSHAPESIVESAALEADLIAAAKELLLACERDMETFDASDGDDEPVGSSPGGNCAVTFGHMRRLRKILHEKGVV